MAAQLRMTVYVTDGRGNVHRFRPGEEIPAWAVARIRNPRAWAEPVSDTPLVKESPAAELPPPQGGQGSGRPVWAAYAARHNVAFTDDDSRDEIIDLCEQAGVPV
jgi:hypothetical protein